MSSPPIPSTVEQILKDLDAATLTRAEKIRILLAVALVVAAEGDQPTP